MLEDRKTSGQLEIPEDGLLIVEVAAIVGYILEQILHYIDDCLLKVTAECNHMGHVTNSVDNGSETFPVQFL